MDIIILAVFLACVITMLIEFIPALFVKEKVGWIKTSILCNVVTNPILNLTMLLMFAAHIPEPILLLVGFIGEIVVFRFEGYIYKRVLGKSKKMCLTYSAVANLLSFLIGSIVWLFVFDFVLGLIDQPVYIPNSNIFERLCVSVF